MILCIWDIYFNCGVAGIVLYIFGFLFYNALFFAIWMNNGSKYAEMYDKTNSETDKYQVKLFP